MNEKSEDQPKKTTQNISSKPDELVKGGKKGKVELTEDELKKISGGHVTSAGMEKWIV
jgi:bacteriocin-like protein